MSDKKFRITFPITSVTKENLIEILDFRLRLERMKPKEIKPPCIAIEMYPTLELEYGTFARIIGITNTEVIIVLADDFNKANTQERFQKRISHITFLQNIKEIH